MVSFKYSGSCPWGAFVLVGESHQSVGHMNIYATLKKITAKKRNIGAMALHMDWKSRGFLSPGQSS